MTNVPTKIYEVKPGEFYVYHVDERSSDCKRGAGHPLIITGGSLEGAKRIAREETAFTGMVVPFFCGGTFRV